MKWYVKILILFAFVLTISSCTTTTVGRDENTRKIVADIKQDTFRLELNPHIEYTQDTTIRVKPFVFRVDTVIQTYHHTNKNVIYRTLDSVEAFYDLLTNRFTLSVKQNQDTIYSEIKTIKERIEVKKSWQDRIIDNFSLLLGGVIVGVLLVVAYYLFYQGKK